ncbi:MAG: putative viral replication protein [Circoviridae sp.]|nr:MAG: putative viral replication protein [Circoviridae sp.]
MVDSILILRGPGNTDRPLLILIIAPTMASRNWVFTVNNPTEEIVYPDYIKIGVHQLEQGEFGTPHYQGYIECKHSVRLEQLKRWLPTAHWEKRKGSRLECLSYVTKESSRIEDTVYFGISDIEVAQILENGTKRSQQENLKEIQKKILDGASDGEIADDFFDIWVKYYKAFSHYRMLKTPKRDWSVETIVIQGATGVGKSRMCMDDFPSAYWKQRSQWWDGYSGEETIIIDEFYGWLPFDTLLRLCDRYPLLLEVKGGQVQCLAKRVIITTNALPHNWYKSNCYFASFVRRVTEWVVIRAQGMISRYTEYNPEMFINNFNDMDI